MFTSWPLVYQGLPFRFSDGVECTKYINEQYNVDHLPLNGEKDIDCVWTTYPFSSLSVIFSLQIWPGSFWRVSLVIVEEDCNFRPVLCNKVNIMNSIQPMLSRIVLKGKWRTVWFQGKLSNWFRESNCKYSGNENVLSQPISNSFLIPFVIKLNKKYDLD